MNFSIPEGYFKSRQALAPLGVVIFLFLVWTLLPHWSSWRHSGVSGVGSSQCRATDDLFSKVAGGVPGFYVFENVWFKNGSFHLYNPFEAPFPDIDAITSARPNDQDQMVIEQSYTMPSIPDYCFEGTTLITNEGADSRWNGLWHYYHFAVENVLAGFASVASSQQTWSTSLARKLPDMPKRLVIPWDTQWQDRWGMNMMVIDGVFDSFIDPKRWQELVGDGEKWLFFDSIVFIDRHVSHAKNPMTNQWNKMALPMFVQPRRQDFFAPAREKLLRHHGLYQEKEEGHKIVYIDRQSTDRRLSDEDHQGLLDLLEEIGRFEGISTQHALLEEMSIQEQLTAIAHATMIIGIHGNGLTHSMWMQPSSAIIELFPVDTFMRDYASIADTLGLSYWAVVNDTVLTRDTWLAIGGERNAGDLHNGTPVLLDLSVLRRLIFQLL